MIKQEKQSDWVASSEIDVPDFMIIGAMKSGTTTLHKMLNQHPDIAVANDELFFFSQDDIAEHPNFSTLYDRGLIGRASSSCYPDWGWYKARLGSATGKRLSGEDSTTYLCSKRAIARIAKQPKAVKLIIMLRHPTRRVYSHYWHMVRARRALYSFEDTLRFMPQQLLGRSHYLSQLEWVYRHFPREQVKVIQFEEFVKNPQQTLADVSGFLGVEYALFSQETFAIHENAGQLPRFLTLDLVTNRLKRSRDALSDSHFSDVKPKKRLLRKLYRLVNPLVSKKPPEMNRHTKQYLDAYFEHELQGLDELVGQPMMTTWFDMEVRKP